MSGLTFAEKKLAVIENLVELRMIDAPLAENTMYEVRGGAYDRVIAEFDGKDFKLLTDVILELEGM